MEIPRGETELPRELANTMFHRRCDQHVDWQAQHVHDFSRFRDSFCGHSDVSGRIQDLAQPEHKSQIPIDDEDILHLNEPTGRCCNLQTTHE